MKDNACAAYMRFSSNNQTLLSIEYQRSAIEEYCRRTGLEVVQEYIDEAQSGTTDKRKAFTRLIRDACNEPVWSKLLVYDHSRFARNAELSINYTNTLADQGIKLVSVTMDIGSDTPEACLAVGMTHVYNEYYRKNLARTTRNSMIRKSTKALHCGGIPPLGYDTDKEGHLIVNEQEAETVREIFQLYTLGYSYNRMANHFNNRGITTKAGKPFTKNSFYNILTQEKYIGTYTWNRRKAKNSKGQHNNHAYKPLSEQTIIPGGCPVIIEPTLFQRVQELLAAHANGKSASKSRRHYMLSGMQILRCARCGSYMAGKAVMSHGREYIVYSCPQHKGGICPTKDISAEPLNKFVAAVIVNRLVTRKRIPELNKRLVTGNDDAENRRLRYELKGVDRRITNLARSLEEHRSDTLLQNLRELEAKKDHLLRELSSTEKTTPVITEDNIKMLRKKLYRMLQKDDSPEVRRLLLSVVGELNVDNDKVTIQITI